MHACVLCLYAQARVRVPLPVARALASMVLPVPGGPYSSTPRAGFHSVVR